ncbi:MAG TPA: hypothetical protein VNV43_01570 [Candidatus Acidoferrales bacterium]|nr:hypothetical protein [Candidatus Acidoferrales bacterium]
MTRGRLIRACLYALWLSAIGTGIVMVLDYENASGSAASAPKQWLSGTSIPLDNTRDTLIMFAHPRCPCTRASLDELNRLLAQSNGRIAAHVLFFRPSGYPAGWTHTALWQSAAAIPSVAVQDDTNDALARKFGAETSGYVLLYNPSGKLLFRGGITGSRGHAGDNVGESAIISLAMGKPAGVTHTPVYGCSLLTESNSQYCLKP